MLSIALYVAVDKKSAVKNCVVTKKRLLPYYQNILSHSPSIISMKKVLIVDDEKQIRGTLREILEFEKYQVEEATDGLECIVKIQQSNYDVVILDIKMPKMDGMEALEKIQILSPETPVIMVSGHGTINIAVDAVKKGAFDFIAKPPDLNRLLITIRNAMERKDLVQTNTALTRKSKKGSSKAVKIVGESAALRRVMAQLEKVAPARADVLILGPNGTGKELVARYIHEKSERADGPLVEVNCAAITETLIDSEFFGHKKGAFTGAHADRIGYFAAANGGTLFLDEIGDMSLAAQSKVLTALQERKFIRVGDTKATKVDIRVIAATNKDLPKEIIDKNFRTDLYMRLSTAVVHVPSLNDRKEDLPLLIAHFNKNLAREYNKPQLHFTDEAMRMLMEYNWMGNIRELANVVERMFIYCDYEVKPEHIEQHVYPNSIEKLLYA